MDLLRYYELTANKAKLIVVNDEDLMRLISDSKYKEELSDFIYKRLFYRYINPFLYKSEKKIQKDKSLKLYDEFLILHKNGFSMMANSCLLIETIESFYRGWSNTSGKSETAFLKFFGRDKNFILFASNDLATSFYKNIRCGILHQAETTGGWSITRNSRKLLDEENKIIDSTLFLETLNLSLINYKTELIKSDWNDLIWKNARNKLKSIIKNAK